MKVKVKFSSTQKFIVKLEESTLGNLRNEIRKFLENTYKESVREPLTLSLNGSDPLHGSDDTSLASLGVVPGDMLIILPTQENPESSASVPPASASVPPASASSSCSERTASGHTNQTMDKPNQADQPSAGMPSGNAGGMGRLTLLEVSDGCPSPAMENLFTKCSPISVSEAVNLIVHLTMLECGFHLQSNLEIPPGWKEMVATLQYCHNSFSEFKCTLALVTMGEVKQILASFPQQESTITVQIKIGEYIKDSSKRNLQANDLVKVAQLSRTLRDRILHPLQVAAHQTLGVPAPWHLAGLPLEMLLVIMSSLDARSVLNVGQCCQHLHSAVGDNTLWRKLFKRDYKNLYKDMVDSNLVDWKAEYRKATNRVKDWERLHNEDMNFVIPGMQPPNPLFGPPYPTVPYPEMPRPRGPNPYPPQPHPNPNPFHDPDSPFFGGDIPPLPNPFPNFGDPFDPYGMQPRRPNPMGPFNPPFMPPRPGNPRRGPRFDYF